MQFVETTVSYQSVTMEFASPSAMTVSSDFDAVRLQHQNAELNNTLKIILSLFTLTITRVSFIQGNGKAVAIGEDSVVVKIEDGA